MWLLVGDWLGQDGAEYLLSRHCCLELIDVDGEGKLCPFWEKSMARGVAANALVGSGRVVRFESVVGTTDKVGCWIMAGASDSD